MRKHNSSFSKQNKKKHNSSQYMMSTIIKKKKNVCDHNSQSDIVSGRKIQTQLDTDTDTDMQTLLISIVQCNYKCRCQIRQVSDAGTRLIRGVSMIHVKAMIIVCKNDIKSRRGHTIAGKSLSWKNTLHILMSLVMTLVKTKLKNQPHYSNSSKSHKLIKLIKDYRCSLLLWKMTSFAKLLV